MKEAKYFRKGKVIRGPNGDDVFKFVNEAKRKSRTLQKTSDGALGRGSLRVVDNLPEAAE